MRRKIRNIFLGLLVLIAMLAASGYTYLQHPKFGSVPDGARLERIQRSPHYQDGTFHNLEPTPKRRGNVISSWTRMLFAEKERPTPPAPVPSVKTDFHALNKDDDLVVWLGHSSYYIQLEGKRYLIDPVFNTHASPIPFINRAFGGTIIYAPEDFPTIDYLLITHDHWDHLDYPTLRGLKDKINKIIAPLGVGAHLEHWGFSNTMFHELDWYEELSLDDSLTIHSLPTHHYSGRLLTRNQTLWTAYALISPGRKLYLGGDSGYGAHFKAAGDSFDGFDLAILDNGQYNENWRWVHMMPEDAALAAKDLRTKAVMPVHTGKFSMAYHAWDDAYGRMVKASEGQPYELVMPLIGEVVPLNDMKQRISRWWESLNQERQ